jgi:hypothetical protein
VKMTVHGVVRCGVLWCAVLLVLGCAVLQMQDVFEGLGLIDRHCWQHRMGLQAAASRASTQCKTKLPYCHAAA